MKPIFSNDKSAPRMRKGKFSKHVITKELWERFRKEFPEYDISWTDFKQDWEEIAETIREESITNPLGVRLGSYMGELKYQFLPHKFEGADIQTSNELGRAVTHLNIVTRGKTAKIKWERRQAVKFNKMLQFYAFEPDRKMRPISKQYTDANPDSVRMARNTLGGYSIWRQY